MIVASACLLGFRCRYDGGSCPDSRLVALFEGGKVIPMCPEQMGGLPTPRCPLDISEGDGYAVLDGQAKVVNGLGEDRTGGFLLGAQEALKLCKAWNPGLVILKEGSPSCGVTRIAGGAGSGVTAARLKREGFRVLGNEEHWEGEGNG